MEKELLQKLYSMEEYYWGKEPNALAHKVSEHLSPIQCADMRLLELGCGEGRDSVFLAQYGFDVLAVDFAPAGLAKAQKLAKEMNVMVRTLEGNLNDLLLSGEFDVVYSCGALEYIEPQNRARQFTHFQEHTVPGGIHFLFVFIEHPEIELAPDWGSNEYLYGREELPSYYAEWTTLESYEYIFPCNSSGVPHQHAARVLIAKKPA